MSLCPTNAGTAAISSAEISHVGDTTAPFVASDPCDGPKQLNAVFLNVYDVIGANGWLWYVGLGVHHVGIQVYDDEYQYGRCEEGTGVAMVEPRHSQGQVFREQLYLGQTNLSSAAVKELVEAFRQKDSWQGKQYHLIKHNCIDFVQELSRALLSPEVRVAQMRRANRITYESWPTETVEVEGRKYTVPVLIPPHIDRLCRHAKAYLPEWALQNLDNMDNPFPQA
ncbi:hypothetical protein ABB37_07026 [Leptomonas pyrrhocoris]|uniref:PPPDE domain-containing protein n=1 Tax=Leptomonas pyrrhocoris TaxID=157538 RepID=A0A0N0DTP4_LEPPY|nr:hypothetical protein ABB37_07026 [Leptomonas pyrrhocoris]XP_015656135.1 hypothetical protein ABB37_07026 [Leptomonas pyrrhocoris]XP_015656136.1 hypothetical protein ABB37_07026 [Leptomonas pyrrhocoris]XP_015656137.1 hypothetical protein ABB37_07026 [Leptomonas pyrrhocoris]KPA77695.1 hypothetical protein ABB37_07026 [Leptomonas pyrrhocoris]KPA77696.1 hypothetical protein ABB37_07026 [Leptomonas pyrrhocoris]KPA77697.1 hypothetical protein ABB37_07026 [Leptomonas pyrrhocoris]KPA77698.1 hypot|eukprot:XP_015656134.1 hypothetical protein ABB37_07026 [Leptomonas pyrrhocoris]